MTVTQQELEKAASVRLFEKFAAANDVDLSTLSRDELEATYEDFNTRILPSLVGKTADAPAETAEKTAEAVVAEVTAKLASLTQNEIAAHFEKQASVEGLDIEKLADDQLGSAMDYFMESVLPVMAAQNWEPVTEEQYAKIAEAQEAQVKLAEAEVLGRHMARAFSDEAQKIAEAAKVADPPRILDANGNLKKPSTNTSLTTVAKPGIKERLSGAVGKGIAAIKEHPGKSALIGGGVLAAGAATAAGIHAHNKNKAETPKEASVTLNAADIEVLQKMASAGDLEGFKKATAEIAKAAEFPPKKDGDKDDECEKCHKDPCVCEKSKEAEALDAVDLLVEQRASEMATQWLIDNGHAVAE